MCKDRGSRELLQLTTKVEPVSALIVLWVPSPKQNSSIHGTT